MTGLALPAALAAVSLAFAVGTLRADNPGAGDPFTLNFDENGNGSVSQNGGPFVNNPGQILPDPTQAGAPGGGSPPALTYFLPELVTNGEIQVFEPPGFTGVSDVLRFTDANGNMTGQTADRMIYYSDNLNDGGDAVADISGLPFNLGAFGFSSIPETGQEGGFQDFQWVPGGGNVYNGISDIPEPGTVTLMAIGVVCFGGFAWRRRRRTA